MPCIGRAASAGRWTCARSMQLFVCMQLALFAPKHVVESRVMLVQVVLQVRPTSDPPLLAEALAAEVRERPSSGLAQTVCNAAQHVRPRLDQVLLATCDQPTKPMCSVHAQRGMPDTVPFSVNARWGMLRSCMLGYMGRQGCSCQP